MIAEKYPLQWPIGYPRTKYPSRSRFGSQPFGRTRDAIMSELDKLLNYNERKTIVLSTNIPLKQDGFPYANYRQPDDKGVAVYFEYKKEQVVLCCDAWNTIEHNMWSIAKTIEAIRGIERWGVSDFLKRSFTGFTALPPKAEDQPKREWWSVFNYAQKPGSAAWDREGFKAQYISLAKKAHPDAGGSNAAFQELNEAYDQGKKYFGL